MQESLDLPLDPPGDEGAAPRTIGASGDLPKRASHASVFVDDAHRFKKAGKSLMNQQLGEALLQRLALAHCSVGSKHG